MISINEVIETNAMISRMNLDVRTITMGISLLDCVGGTLKETCDNIYNKITMRQRIWFIQVRKSLRNMVFQS